MNMQKEKQFSVPMDHEQMMRVIDDMASGYGCLSVRFLGETIMGRGIPLLSLGEGEKTVLYVGAHGGTEWITTQILVRFAWEYCRAYERKGKIFGHDIEYFFSTRTILIVPMLNPDGVEYVLHGVEPDQVIYERLIKMNGGSEDFSCWQSNGRGVDLNHNYQNGFLAYKKIEREQGILGGAPQGYSGEHPESEPETGYLCNLIRYDTRLRAVLSLHSRGEGIYYTAGGQTARRSYAIAKALSKMSGYDLRQSEELLEQGGLRDFCIAGMDLAAFSVACGRGLKTPPGDELFYVYSRLREMLFLMPTLV